MTLAADGHAITPTLPALRPPRAMDLAEALIALCEAAGDGIVEVDQLGVARGLNAAGAAMLAQAGGREGALAPAELLDALAASRSADDVVVLGLAPAGRESGASRHLRAAAYARGGLRLIALRDSTEERLLHERLLQSEKMASVGQLVSGVAHELNNPLTGVMGFAQLLMARDLDEAAKAQVRTIYGEAERAAKIVQNLLSFARRRKPAKEMADVNALLAQVLELRSYDFAIRNISLDMALDPWMPRCWVDADQVQQVFFNVVKNAEQAMIDANGGGRLIVRTRAVQPSERNEGAPGRPWGVRVTIEDDGPGISQEAQRRIFDPFFTTKEAGKGTGLGLTISYGIIDEHGGRIWAETGSAGGAAFVIELPVGGPEQAEAGPLPSPEAGTGAASAGNGASNDARPRYKVLVVDDEESIRLLLRDILTMDGHRVEVASSGIEAWARTEDGGFDVIVTDMKMPGMDGATFYRELRQRDPALAERIVFITGDTVSSDTRAFLQEVRNPVLSKPFKVGPLREAMELVTSGTVAARPA